MISYCSIKEISVKPRSVKIITNNAVYMADPHCKLIESYGKESMFVHNFYIKSGILGDFDKISIERRVSVSAGSILENISTSVTLNQSFKSYNENFT